MELHWEFLFLERFLGDRADRSFGLAGLFIEDRENKQLKKVQQFYQQRLAEISRALVVNEKSLREFYHKLTLE